MIINELAVSLRSLFGARVRPQWVDQATSRVKADVILFTTNDTLNTVVSWVAQDMRITVTHVAHGLADQSIVNITSVAYAVDPPVITIPLGTYVLKYVNANTYVLPFATGLASASAGTFILTNPIADARNITAATPTPITTINGFGGGGFSASQTELHDLEYELYGQSIRLGVVNA